MTVDAPTVDGRFVGGLVGTVTRVLRNGRLDEDPERVPETHGVAHDPLVSIPGTLVHVLVAGRVLAVLSAV